MRSAAPVVKRFLAGVSLLGTMSIATVPSHPREIIVKLAVAAVPVDSPAREHYSTADFFSRLIERHHWQAARLDRLSVVRTYKVENDKDKTLALEVVVMEYRGQEQKLSHPPLEKARDSYGTMCSSGLCRLRQREHEPIRTRTA